MMESKNSKVRSQKYKLKFKSFNTFNFLIAILTFAFCLLTFSNYVYGHSSIQVIEMTESGFVPSEVTIDQNQTVLFINKDSKPRWPASNTHPTHELYPQFDPIKVINTGESWAFKAEKAGEWKFHDHLNPHARGVLKVVSEDGQIYQPSWFDRIKASIISFFTKLKNPIAPRNNPDPDAAKNWEELKQKYKGQAGSMGNIHDLAHQAGSLLYEKLGFDGLSKCTTDFAFGCYHGFLDKAFAKNLDYLIEAQDACLKLGPEGSGPVGSCIHGIGHGVASFHLTKDLKVSLSDCRKLTSGREFCFDGVFMEFVRSAPDSFYSREKPIYPCNELESQFGPVYSQACGRNQPSLLMGRFKMGMEEVIKVCLNSDSNTFKSACFDSIGFSLASAGEVDQIIRGCQAIAEEQYVSACLKSAAGELIFQEVPGWNENSKAICDSAPISGQKQCFDQINRIISEYGRKDK